MVTRVKLIAVCVLTLVALTAQAEYSPWSFFGGLNYIYNANGDGIAAPPVSGPSGSPGGLASAPSPLVGFLGAEYAYPVSGPVSFAPSASIFLLTHLWADDRALPAEIENRTALTPSILLDGSFTYSWTKGRFRLFAGGGPGILLRYSFLDTGVGEDDISYTDDVPAGKQVDKINAYHWSALRWFYPMARGGVTYQLETGWGAGLTLRLGMPVFNLWSDYGSSVADSLMIMLALTITPPAPRPRLDSSIDQTGEATPPPSADAPAANP